MGLNHHESEAELGAWRETVHHGQSRINIYEKGVNICHAEDHGGRRVYVVTLPVEDFRGLIELLLQGDWWHTERTNNQEPDYDA